MKDNPKIFISYSWKNKVTVDEIDKYFQSIGITLIKDERTLKYKDSIKKYMKRIRKTDFVLMIISDSFLKSSNCMYEVLEFVKDENYKDRILPIVLEDAKISRPEGRLKYTKYWQDKFNDLKNSLSCLKDESKVSLVNDLRFYKNINNSISEFLSGLSEMLYIPIETLKETNYRAILEMVGYGDSFLNSPVLKADQETKIIDSYLNKLLKEIKHRRKKREI
jgi:hypothetical protein